MAGFQFVHIETYSRNPPKKGGGKASMRGVFAEAKREPEACPHVSTPRPPVPLAGMDLDALEAEINEQAAVAKDARGHALRKDAAVLLAGVATYPAGWNHLDDSAYSDWEKRTLEWLRDEFGDNLKAVIRHVDETYPHIHFYAAPKLGSDGRFNAKDLHHGHQAAAGLKGREAQGAYKAAMRDFQDRYHSQVGMPCGLTRLGPSRRRLSRAAWKAEQAQADSLRIAQAAAEAANKTASAILFDARIDAQLEKHEATEAAAEKHAEAAEAERARQEAVAEMEVALIERNRAATAVEQARQWFIKEKANLEAERSKVQAERQNLDQQRAAIEAGQAKLENAQNAIIHERQRLNEEWAAVSALKAAYLELTEPLRRYAHEFKRWAHQFRAYIKPTDAADQALEAANMILDRIETEGAALDKAHSDPRKATLSMQRH